MLADVDAPTRDPLVGRLVASRYRVLARIARGGMATVYRAEDTRLGREIALKVMHPHLAESTEFVERFQDEARAAASLQHRHVVAVHDQGEDGDTVWLAMELLPGRTLRDELREGGAFSPAEVFEVVQSVLLALAEAHGTGLVHRDVKPENVLLARDGTWKVNDFGLARAASSSRTATGSLLGTPEYIAPETARTGEVTPLVDVYSTGIILFELLTGRQPHTGDVPFQVVWAHVTSDVPPPSRWAPYLPRSVDRLVAEACERDPARRTGSAADLLTALRRVWSTLPPEVLDSRPDPDQVDVDLEGPSDDPSDADGATRVISRAGLVAAASGTATLPRVPVPPTDDRPTQGSGGYDDDHGYDDDQGYDDGPWYEDDGDGPVDGWSGRHHDDPPAVEPRRRRPGLAGVLLVLLLASLVAGAALWYYEAGPGAQRLVPDLAGRTAQAAATQLDAIGIASTTTTAFDEQVPEGVVVSTRPAASETVHKNGTVTLVVSAGPELFPVPDLRGLGRDDAERALTDAGLSLGAVAEAFDPQVEAGRVVSSDPTSGQTLRRGSEVALVLSRGPQPVDVPDLTGLDADDARAALEERGLRLGDTVEDFAAAAPGTVVAQDPAEGQVPPGTAVDVTVSLGPEPVEVPSVFESRYEDAVAELEGLGFVVERRGSGIFNRVVSQDPPAGTELPPGSTVVVTTF